MIARYAYLSAGRLARIRLHAQQRACVVTLEGESGTGKNRLGVELAWRFGLPFLSLGSLLRWAVREARKNGVDALDAAEVARLVGRISPLEIHTLSTAEQVDNAADFISAGFVGCDGRVRRALNARANRMASAGLVVAGVDFGQQWFPSAHVKLYLAAADEARFERKADQLGVLPEDARRIMDQIARRQANSGMRPGFVPPGRLMANTTKFWPISLADEIALRLRLGEPLPRDGRRRRLRRAEGLLGRPLLPHHGAMEATTDHAATLYASPMVSGRGAAVGMAAGAGWEGGGGCLGPSLGSRKGEGTLHHGASARAFGGHTTSTPREAV